MAEVMQHVPGTFSWTELGTTDVEGAKPFYTGLFGWDTHDVPAGEAGTYTLCRLDGKDVAGLYRMSEEQLSQGVPPAWLSYVTVDDLDQRAGLAETLGGKLVAPPFDVMDTGRMALIQDPTGAMLALWQPGTHIGAHLINQPGCLTWNELLTTDAEKAARFYTALFGWETEVDESGPLPYTTFLNRGTLSGGMLQMTEEWGSMPSHWMPYFAVADCDAAVARVQELGGRVSVPPTDIPAGTFAVIQDPQGAVFSIIRLAEQ